MLPNCINTSACWDSVVHIIIFHGECEDFGGRVDSVRVSDSSLKSFRGLSEFTYDHSVYDGSSNVGMSIWSHTRLIFENISTIEEFADVPSNMEVDKKLPAGMFRFELRHVQDHVVEEYEFLSPGDHVIEVSASDPLLHIPERLLFAAVYLVENLE